MSISDTEISGHLPEPNAKLQALMKKARIPGISIASLTEGGLAQNSALGFADMQSGELVSEDTVFGAASLSKPVFAYLVLKLIEKGELDSDFLDTPLHQTLPEYKPFFQNSTLAIPGKVRFDSSEAGRAMTARLVVSHRTGLDNWINPEKTFEFHIGNKFGYSGEGFHYLQEVIEHRTGQSLQQLAKTHVFDPIGMPHSSFSVPKETQPGLAVGHDTEMNPKQSTDKLEENAGASLHTTAKDYARFLVASLHENDPIFTDYLEPTVLVTENATAKESVSWSLGWGLQHTERARVAFHWGDKPNFKAFTAINLDNRSAIVYFTNSQNGLAMTQEIVDAFAPNIGSLKPSLDYLEEKYGYQKMDDTPGWEQRYDALVAEIRGGYHLALELFTEASGLNPDNTMTQPRL